MHDSEIIAIVFAMLWDLWIVSPIFEMDREPYLNAIRSIATPLSGVAVPALGRFQDLDPERLMFNVSLKSGDNLFIELIAKCLILQAGAAEEIVKTPLYRCSIIGTTIYQHLPALVQLRCRGLLL